MLPEAGHAPVIATMPVSLSSTIATVAAPAPMLVLMSFQVTVASSQVLVTSRTSTGTS